MAHLANEGGLHAHSVGSFYPLRIEYRGPDFIAHIVSANPGLDIQCADNAAAHLCADMLAAKLRSAGVPFNNCTTRQAVKLLAQCLYEPDAQADFSRCKVVAGSPVTLVKWWQLPEKQALFTAAVLRASTHIGIA